MRAFDLFLISSPVLCTACTLHSEGLGEYPGAGGDSVAGSGGVSFDASGAGGAITGGSGGSSTGSGGEVTGGTGASGGADAGVEAGSDALLIEDCFNLLDDDLDGNADCADDDCVAVVMCVPLPPPGWSAPGVIHTRLDGDPPADCGEFEPAGTYHSAYDAGEHTCQCKCGAPSGGVCSGGSATVYFGSSCTGTTVAVTGAGCFDLSSPSSTNTDISLKATAADPTGQGMCSPEVLPLVDTAVWVDAADFCVASQTFAGCGASRVCMRRPPDGFDARACIASTTHAQCPADYPSTKTWYTALKDTRSCTSAGCSCGHATGGECSGHVRLHTDTTCSDASTVRSYDLDGACHDTQLAAGDQGSMDFVVSGPGGGACAVAGEGTRMGSVSLEGASTICCQAAAD